MVRVVSWVACQLGLVQANLGQKPELSLLPLNMLDSSEEKAKFPKSEMKTFFFANPN